MSEKPKIIVVVEGGVVTAARASVPMDIEILDCDNPCDDHEEEAEFKALEADYFALPEAIY